MKILNEKKISWTSWFSVTSVWYNGDAAIPLRTEFLIVMKPLKVPAERPGVWVPPLVHSSRDGKAMEDNRVTLGTQHVPLPSKWQEGFQNLIYLSKIITACQISKLNRIKTRIRKRMWNLTHYPHCCVSNDYWAAAQEAALCCRVHTTISYIQGRLDTQWLQNCVTAGWESNSS